MAKRRSRPREGETRRTHNNTRGGTPLRTALTRRECHRSHSIWSRCQPRHVSRCQPRRGRRLWRRGQSAARLPGQKPTGCYGLPQTSAAASMRSKLASAAGSAATAIGSVGSIVHRCTGSGRAAAKGIAVSRPTQLAARSRRSRRQGDGQCSPPGRASRVADAGAGAWLAGSRRGTHCSTFLRSRGGSLSNLIRAAADGTTSTLA